MRLALAANNAGSQPEQRDRGGSDTQGGGDGRTAQANVIEPREIRRRKEHEGAHQPDGDHQSQRTAGDRQRHGFHEQLPHDVAERRAECAPHRDLARPPRCAEQEEVADVEAGDEEQQRHSCRQRREHGFDVAEHGLGERSSVRAAKGRVGDDAVLDGEILITRRGERCARCQPRHGERGYAVAVPSLPHGNPVVDAGRVAEARRRDADDSIVPAEQRLGEPPADHRRVAAEACLPRGVAQHQHLGGVTAAAVPGVAGIIVAGMEHPSQRRPHPEHVEEIAGRHSSIERQRPLAVEHRPRGGGPVRYGGDIANRSALAPEHRHLLWAGGDLGSGIVTVCPHHRDAILIDHRQATHNDRAEDREHGDGHADAEREDHHHGNREAGGAAKAADGKPDVLGQSVHMGFDTRTGLHHAAGA